MNICKFFKLSFLNINPKQKPLTLLINKITVVSKFHKCIKIQNRLSKNFYILYNIKKYRKIKQLL